MARGRDLAVALAARAFGVAAHEDHVRRIELVQSCRRSWCRRRDRRWGWPTRRRSRGTRSRRPGPTTTPRWRRACPRWACIRTWGRSRSHPRHLRRRRRRRSGRRGTPAVAARTCRGAEAARDTAGRRRSDAGITARRAAAERRLTVLAGLAIVAGEARATRRDALVEQADCPTRATGGTANGRCRGAALAVHADAAVALGGGRTPARAQIVDQPAVEIAGARCLRPRNRRDRSGVGARPVPAAPEEGERAQADATHTQTKPSRSAHAFLRSEKHTVVVKNLRAILMVSPRRGASVEQVDDAAVLGRWIRTWPRCRAVAWSGTASRPRRPRTPRRASSGSPWC